MRGWPGEIQDKLGGGEPLEGEGKIYIYMNISRERGARVSGMDKRGERKVWDRTREDREI